MKELWGSENGAARASCGASYTRPQMLEVLPSSETPRNLRGIDPMSQASGVCRHDLVLFPFCWLLVLSQKSAREKNRTFDSDLKIPY